MPRGNQHKKSGLTEQIVIRVTPEMKEWLGAVAAASTTPNHPVTASDIARFILSAAKEQNPEARAYK